MQEFRISDASNFDVNNIPNHLKGGAFLICRIVFKNAPGGNDFLVDQDRRGGIINATGGGGGSGVIRLLGLLGGSSRLTEVSSLITGV